jgi:hypothetical protein
MSALRTADLAACTAALAEASRPMASSRSFLLTAFTAAKGLIFSRFRLGGVELAIADGQFRLRLLQGCLERPRVDLKWAWGREQGE